MLLSGLAWPYLKDYQKTRIYTFLDPSLDPRGAGYQKIQSQIAVGSGGLLGKGFGEGSQAQLGYLPARHTDFILSVLAEEAGFLGVAAVLGLYLLWLWRMLETAQLARDRLGAFLCAAIAAGFAFQVVYNSAMVAGLVPVKGLPLPLAELGRLVRARVAHLRGARAQCPHATLCQLILPHFIPPFPGPHSAVPAAVPRHRKDAAAGLGPFVRPQPSRPVQTSHRPRPPAAGTGRLLGRTLP